MRKRNYVKSQRNAKTAATKKLLIASVVLFGIYLIVSFILGEMGLVKYFRMKAQYVALNGEIEKLRQDNIRLMKDVRSLKSDPAYLERIARDKLGLARQGEIVYYYGESGAR